MLVHVGHLILGLTAIQHTIFALFTTLAEIQASAYQTDLQSHANASHIIQENSVKHITAFVRQTLVIQTENAMKSLQARTNAFVIEATLAQIVMQQ